MLKISKVMEEVKELRVKLQMEVDSQVDHRRLTSSKIHEIKTTIKNMCKHPDITKTLNRLELNGEPIWGLSTKERDFVVTCRMQSK